MHLALAKTHCSKLLPHHNTEELPYSQLDENSSKEFIMFYIVFI